MKYRRAAEKMLGPYIQERLDVKLDENGQKPDDLVQRLIDAAPPIEKTCLFNSFVKVFTGALYALAAQFDKYAGTLCQEVLENLEQGEIASETVKKLPKMDSFLLSMQRNARKDFKFSYGTVLPAGAKVGSPSLILHRDVEVYENPESFDAFRFLAPKYVETKENTPISTSRSFHVFGHGRYPCPG
ncbi:hypothetical protein LCI18_002303 [Fusarium solani-melongenae]|uniref:Uncharacterized protein n=1 Tax=Fusarium solani subsp. cucurbitae TaxID=2747967 RepID=A0ACD3YU38_FUSSC|nr:hypothetical protein LCI18_002303 [Fusarium solani-melongenae]